MEIPSIINKQTNVFVYLLMLLSLAIDLAIY